MGNGIKHEEKILAKIKEIMQSSNGIISQDQVIQVIAQFYSQNYSELGGLSAITRSLNQRGIANKVKVKIPSNFTMKSSNSKHAPSQQFITVFVDSSIPADKRSKIIVDYIKDSIHTLAPTFHRSVSREILAENTDNIPQKNLLDTEFFSVKFRAMLLHLFLIHNFPNQKLDLNKLLESMPIGLSIQIFRTLDPKFFCLHPSIVVPFQQDKLLELNMLIATLKPPYNPLIIDGVVQTKTEIEIQNLEFSKLFDFKLDPLAHLHYWTLVNSIANLPFQKYPITVVQRFEQYLNFIYNDTVLFSLPFFPRDVEEEAYRINVPPLALSNYIQKLYKKKLRIINHPRKAFLESHLFPSSGAASMIVSGKSALPSLEFSPPQYFSGEFDVDNSVHSIAKLFLASRLSNDGYIMSKRANYELLKEKAHLWIENNSKVQNFAASLLNEDNFVSIYNEVASNIMIAFHGLASGGDINVTASEINNLYTVSKIINRLSKPISIAFEFLKSVLSDKELTRNDMLSVRQLCHLRQKHIGKALWALSALGLVTTNNKKVFVNFPKSDYYFDDFYTMKTTDSTISPRPAHFFCYFSDDRTFEIEWTGEKNIENKNIYDIFAPEAAEASKSKIYKFKLREIKQKLPHVKTKEPSKEITNEKVNEEILSTDPLSPLSFARIDTEEFIFPDLMDRYIFSLICSAGVDGIGALELAQAFSTNVTSNLFQTVLEKIESYIRLNLVCRVPSTQFQPIFSRYPACNSIARSTPSKIELVPLHVWVDSKGDVDQEKILEMRRNIVVYVLNNDMCTFDDIVDNFPYISPNDLCMLLEALEADECISSQFSFESSGGLYDEFTSFCTAPLKKDIFLSIISEQKVLETESKLVRRFRTTKASLYNVCI